MGKLDILVMLLLLVSLVIVDFDDVGASFQIAQGNPQGTGELLPDPNLMTIPNVEIGAYSPEFSYQYQVGESNGNLDLKWSHTAGYQLGYDYGYPYVQSNEFARFWQVFNWPYNQTPVTLKIQTTVEISCTGDFASQENGQNMYSVNVWIRKPELGSAYLLKVFDDIESGQSYDLEFQTQTFEAKSIFYGSIMYDSVQAYPSDDYELAVGLAPTSSFIYPYSNPAPWEVVEGTVTVTVSHFSCNALLQVDKITPVLKAPKYNTTTMWNDTAMCFALESIGQNSLAYVSQNMSVYPYSLYLGKLASQHTPIIDEKALPYELVMYEARSFKVAGNKMYLLGTDQLDYRIRLITFDSSGNEIWNSSFSLFDQDVPLLLDVSASGYIYIVSLSARQVADIYPYDLVFSLLCVNQGGTALWNQTLKVMSYEEYLAAALDLQLPRGVGCSSDDVYVSMMDSIMKFDSSGNLRWAKTVDHEAFCVDPAGGVYTCTKLFDDDLRLCKWNSAGVVVWNKSLGLNYGLGWRDNPYIAALDVGPSGQLIAVLAYSQIHPASLITRISPAGQIVSQDTISEQEQEYPFFPYDPYYFYYYGVSYYSMIPYICDMALTQDGLVHLAVSTNTYGAYPYSLLTSLPADTLLTYELSGPIVITFSPESLIITGAATLIFGGIAWDHFIRGRTRPEEILPEQERVDPWKLLMGEADDD
ncbi:MAG: hypothetical protein EAX87_06755 [Candidatus Thorarchaeota archaeon]|nr:hypothetical protein [Candidatus Thorarchaeota archaeon]